jgi:hypothetical protein
MNDRPGREPPGGGHHGFAGGKPVRKPGAAKLLAFAQDLRAAGPVDRSIHAAAAEQAGIGRVNDGVNLQLRDIADSNLHYSVQKGVIESFFKHDGEVP